MADTKKYMDQNSLVELFKIVYKNFATKENLIEDENVIANAFNAFANVMGDIKSSTGEIIYVPSTNNIIKSAKSLTDADEIMAKKIEEISNKIDNTDSVGALDDSEIEGIFQEIFQK